MEIVAPAGNFNKLKTAILYGADAVYLAGQKYSLRAGADNFTTAELKQASQFCHKHQKKIYVTLNAYLYDKDFAGLLDYLKFLEQIKIHAVICSDLGVVQLVKENSKIPVHLSTQAFVLNSYHARIWKNLGVKRIVLGRELSIKQAAKIKQETAIEVELFIHGAMCMSYSGHCTISNYTAGRIVIAAVVFKVAAIYLQAFKISKIIQKPKDRRLSNINFFLVFVAKLTF